MPVTTSGGLTGDMDGVGNIWDAAGQYIGNAKSKILTPSTSSSSTGTSSSPLATLEEWAAGIVSRKQLAPGLAPGLMTLEDIVLIVIGLMLIGAAVFTFRETQQVVKQVTRTVRSTADRAITAAAAAA